MKINLSWLKEILNLNISDKKLIKEFTFLGYEVEKFTSLYIYKDIKLKFIAAKIIESKYLDIHNFIYKISLGGNIKFDLIYNKNINNLLNKTIIIIINNKFLTLTKDKLFVISLKPNFYTKKHCDFLTYNYFSLNECKHYMFSIVEIFENIKLGKVLNKELNFTDKYINLNLSLNRFDLCNLIGISNEIYAFHNKNYYLNSGLQYSLYNKHFGFTVKCNEEIDITIITNNKFFFYVGRKIKNVRYDLSKIPLWMYNRLLISDIFFNNPLLNIINYVFIETGIVINIYDLDIIGKKLIITTSKEYLYKRNNSDILLFTTNQDKILSIASKINFNTTLISNKSINIYIESISLTYEFYKTYYKKHINDIKNLNYLIYDSNIQLYAINRVTNLIHKLFGGDIGKINILGTNTNVVSKYPIFVKTNKLKHIIGQTINFNKVKQILHNLNFKTHIINNSYWIVNPPVWRIDINILHDLIEEILKYYGYNKIKFKKLNNKNLICNKNTQYNYIVQNKIKFFLINKGYQEIITYSLVDKQIQKLLFSKHHTAFTIINPISNEMSCMRNSLLNGILNNIIYNQNYQFNRIKIFEIGYCYDKQINIDSNNNIFYLNLHKNIVIKQKLILAGAIYGNLYEKKWCIPYKILPDIYDIKGDIENIFELLLINPEFLDFTIPKLHDNIFHHNEYGYIFFKKIYIGKFGLISNRILSLLNLKNKIIYFELSLESIFTMLDIITPKPSLDFSYLPVYERDISCIVDENIPSNNIIKECKIILHKYLLHIEIFDIYRYNKIKLNNKKSIGIHMILQDSNRTLKNHEINKILELCINKLINKFKIIIRQL